MTMMMMISECKLEDGCEACDSVSGLCTQCPGDMVVDGFGCKALAKASNETDTAVDAAPSRAASALAAVVVGLVVVLLSIIAA